MLVSERTTVSVYSLRAKEQPTVSTPVTWQEVELAVEKGDPELEPAVWRTAYQRLEVLLAAGRVVCSEERDVLLERNASRPPGKKVPEGVLIEKLQELELPSFYYYTRWQAT
jgi:hypothetical protein